MFKVIDVYSLFVIVFFCVFFKVCLFLSFSQPYVIRYEAICGASIRKRGRLAENETGKFLFDQFKFLFTRERI